MSPEEVKSIADTFKIINDITATQPNEWLPLYAALGGAVAGAVASFFPTWFLARRKESSFSKQIENCLISEISALVEIIDHRSYLSAIKEAIAHLRLQPEDTYSLAVEVPEHYSRVYQENCKNIGVVETEIARKIITFHQLIVAVVQDLKTDGPFSSGASLEAFEEMEKIFEQALCIGRELSQTHNKVISRTLNFPR